MGPLGALYAEGRDRIIDLVRDADPTVPVPTCPAWTVKDVLSHVAGIPADILAGRLDGVATDRWTGAQVDARRELTVDEIVAEWRATGPQIDAIVDSFGPTGKQLLTDLTSHEHDIRNALDRPGARDAAVLDTAFDFIVDSALAPAIADRGLAPLEITADEREAIAGGDAEPGAFLTTTRFDLMRAYTGRRSARQVAAMCWDGDFEPYLALFGSGIFSLSPVDVIE